MSKYLTDELAHGHMLGPFLPSLRTAVHINWVSLGRKYRMITNLSYPRNKSVNDGVNSELCPLTYSSGTRVVSSLGKEARQGCTTGQNRYGVSRPCTPTGPAPAGCGMEGEHFCRLHAAIWPALSSQNFQFSGRCH